MNWLQKLAEFLIITIDPSIAKVPIEAKGNQIVYGGPDQLKQITQQAIRRYYTTIDPKGDKFMGSRYIFNVNKISNYYDALTITVQFLPRNKKQGKEKALNPENPLYEYYMQYKGGKSGKTVYKTPKDAIASIPADSSLAYRGMCWEEWQSIRKTGFIMSSGAYNLGDEQKDLTMFGMDPGTALHYAHGFAPIQYQISQTKPGIVIAVPKEGLLTHEDDPEGIPKGELAVKGKMPASQIKHVWMMVVTESDNAGFMEFVIPWVPAWDTQNYKDPLTGVFKLGLDKIKSGSGRLNVISGYAIRPLI